MASAICIGIQTSSLGGKGRDSEIAPTLGGKGRDSEIARTAMLSIVGGNSDSLLSSRTHSLKVKW